MGRHAERLAAQIRRSIQTEMSRGLNDPRIGGMVSITEVHLADDLADATVLVSVHPEEAEALTLHGLRSAAKHFRSRLARSLGTKRVPRLHFKVDRSLKMQARITAALAEDRPGPTDRPIDDDDARPDDGGAPHEPHPPADDAPAGDAKDPAS